MWLYAQVPLVTVLMSGKRKKDYEAVFLALKELLTENGAEIKGNDFSNEGNDFFHNNYIISHIYFPFIFLFYRQAKQFFPR